jgi:pimeloyl-ACP methyl ester carboxylesterase
MISGRMALAGVVVIAGTLLLGVGADAQSDSSAPPYPAPGRLIDIGGWRLHLNCSGEVKASQPTVLLESGAGDFSVDWSLLQPRVAQFARVCSYDRAGNGWSDLGPSPRTMHQIVWELHTLVAKAGERVPVVFVGHSWGGLLARTYVSVYPDEIVGIVLVDSGHERGLWTMVSGKAVLLMETATGRPIPPPQTSGPLRISEIPPAAMSAMQTAAQQSGPNANESRERLPIEAQRMRSWALAQIKTYASNFNPFDAEELALLDAQQRKDHALGDLPLVVLSRGLPDGPAEAEAEHTQMQLALVGLSRAGKQIIATKSRHHIHIDEPELVATSIREVIAAARK